MLSVEPGEHLKAGVLLAVLAARIDVVDSVDVTVQVLDQGARNPERNCDYVVVCCMSLRDCDAGLNFCIKNPSTRKSLLF